MPSKKVLQSITSRADADEYEGLDFDITNEDQDAVIAPLLDYIDFINDPAIQNFVRGCLYKANEEFWTYSSYMTGEDHPPDELAAGGTVLHVRRCFRAAREIAIAMQFSEKECDILFAAVLLHDVTKFVDEDGDIRFDDFHLYTVETFMKNAILEDHNSTPMSGSVTTEIAADDYLALARLIRVHQGYYSPIPETTPTNNLEWAMHLSDLIATRVHYIVDEDPPKWRWEQQNDD